jgi:ADP-heptose:LPS heptosyltransferase
LLKEKACRVVFAGSPEELEDVRRLRKRLNLGAVACFKDIRDYLGLISCADLFVSGDGGPLHMALAVGIRSVGIFYSRDTAYYWYDVPNRPGFTPVFLNRQSAQEKQVDKVWKTVVKILNK